jgi:arsenate reductase-like glutaredoxin family protein
LEWFILFENQREEKIFFDKDKADNFSLAELGYKMSDFFEFEDFAMIQLERKNKFSETSEFYFDDYKLFDLIEMVILFSKNKMRPEVIRRFNSIFQEENVDYQIVEYLITKRSGETLKTLLTLLKDDNLKRKLGSYFNSHSSGDFIASSKISADILNAIFSGYIKDDKPKKIAEIINRLVDKIVTGDTKKDGQKLRLVGYIENLLKISKNLSNDIYDIRHTEKSTIQPTNDDIYKLISSQNMSIVELVVTTLKDDYVLGDNWEKIKEDYIKKYNIDKTTRLVIKKPGIKEPDLPF